MSHSDERFAEKADDPIQVLVVDDHEHVLWGLTKLIQGEWPRMKLAGIARSLADARQMLRARKIDVVVLDVLLEDEDGLELLPSARAREATVVVHTSSRSLEVHRRALQCGARTVVLKEEPASVLLHEIVHAHECRSAGFDAAREQDCHSAVKARIAGFLLSTTRR